MTVYFPDTNQPAPPLLTDDEVIRLCRIDKTCNSPKRTLRMYREEGKIRARKCKRGFVYRLEDVLEFMKRGAGHV